MAQPPKKPRGAKAFSSVDDSAFVIDERSTEIEEAKKDDAALWRFITRTASKLPAKPLHYHAPEPMEMREAEEPAPVEEQPKPNHAVFDQPQALATPHKPGAQALTLNNPAGLDHRMFQRIKRGKLPIESRLDLHSLKREEAYDALFDWVKQSHAQGRRMLLLITGKGLRNKGILRNSIESWLNEPQLRPLILTLCEATLRHGGRGAFYIYLRKN